MKVKELITSLSKYDPEMSVVTRGLDEDGFDDITEIKTVNIKIRESETMRKAIGEYEVSKSNEQVAILIDHN